jgi:hypothetical protein
MEIPLLLHKIYLNIILEILLFQIITLIFINEVMEDNVNY